MPNIGAGISIGGGISLVDPTPIQGDLPLVIYDAGNTLSYPGTGTTWSDLAGRNNNAALINTPTYVSNGSASSFQFNGTSQSASLDSTKLNVNYTGKTVMVAARMDVGYTVDGTYRAFFGTSNTVAVRNFNFYMFKNASGYAFHWSAGGFGTNSNVLTLTTNQWFIGAVTHTTGNQVTYYLNNVSVGTPTQTFTQYQSGDNAFVARADNYWWGDLPFVAVFGSALTTEQLTFNYNYLKDRYGIT